jgi:hypothetical protein
MQFKEIHNAIEFCREYRFGEKCSLLASQNISFADFWDNCENAEWMLWLLDATNYRKTDDLLEFFVESRASLKNSAYYDHIQVSGEEFRLSYTAKISKLEEETKTGKIKPENARLAMWGELWTYARSVVNAVAQEARIDAIWEESGKARSSKDNEDEIKIIIDEAAKKAFNDSLKDQANFLRTVIDNPFFPKNPNDFE